jgi:hypothetical protein
MVSLLFCYLLVAISASAEARRGAMTNTGEIPLNGYNPQSAREIGGARANTNPDALTVAFSEPRNGTSIDAACVNVRGMFKGKNIKKIQIEAAVETMTIPAFIRGNTFEARDVFLQPGTNWVTVIAENREGNVATNALMLLGPSMRTNVMKLPVQIHVAPSGGFAPATVSFEIEANVPGRIQKVSYDFDGDDTPDQVDSDLHPVTHTYKASGEYFPVVTIQTTVGSFSSLSGPMAEAALLFGGSESAFVNVQAPPVVLSSITVADPVDIKWTAASNLYVLSGSTSTITEFDTQGKIVRSKNQIGANPSGFAVDADGNIYAAVTGNNQIWKFRPTKDSFEVDESFGSGGFIGNKDGSPGSGVNQFSAPFDAVISRDGKILTVSDSGNRRLQQFPLNGVSHGPLQGSQSGVFKTPKGMAYDDIGVYLFIVDSEANRIGVALDDLGPVGMSGTNGSALGQFDQPTHVSANKRALYVADSGNNRVQMFAHVEGGEGVSLTPFRPRLALAGELGLKHPQAVAAVDDFLKEKLYIADTGNNRVLLVHLPSDNPEAMWKDLMAKMKAGDVEGAVSHFCASAQNNYRQTFNSLSKEELRSMCKDMENINAVTIERDHAQYHFESVMDGHTLTFPVEFYRELGQWKVLEY